MSKDTDVAARNIDTLINRLREDGVAAGREEAARLHKEAQTEASAIVAAARAEAEKHLAEARKAADNYRAAGEEALETAMRDAVLTMKTNMMVQLEADVRRLVSKTASDPDVIRQMVLELVGSASRAVGDSSAVDVILPAEVVGPEAIRDNPEEIQSGALTQFVLGLTHDMLEEGVTLYASEEFRSGIRAHVKDKDITIDLTEEAVAALLMQHLQPRFRAVLEGVIK